jgi:hypothetical protein
MVVEVRKDEDTEESRFVSYVCNSICSCSKGKESVTREAEETSRATSVCRGQATEQQH